MWTIKYIIYRVWVPKHSSNIKKAPWVEELKKTNLFLRGLSPYYKNKINEKYIEKGIQCKKKEES